MQRSKAFAIALFLGAALGGCGQHQGETGPVNVTTTPEPPQISVSGEATVKVVPDEVILSIGVNTSDATVKAAKQRNDEAIQAVQAAALANGVEAKNIQSDYLSIDPRYDDSYLRRHLASVVAHRSVVIRLRDISRYDQLLGAVVEVGANTIHGVTFQTTELRKYRDEARRLALQAAKEKAIAMAATLDKQIGMPLGIEEEQIHSWSSYYWPGAMGGFAGQSQNVVSNQGPQASEPEGTVAPGQISVSARVRVRFLLR